MRKIFILAIAVLLSQNVLFAQSGKSVSEKDVPERYVKDFKNQLSDVKSVKWEMVDSLVYDARFTSENGTLTVYRFSPKGTEIRWYVEEKYYPRAIVDLVKDMHPGYTIKELYALYIKNKTTYQVLIGKRKGYFTKKWRNMRYMNFEADYKFIDEIDL